MRRRVALASGVAAVAVAAGIGSALWRQRAGRSAQSALWPMRFDTPEGGQLALAPLRGQPLLLNFWATWCPPCVVELPLLDQFQREQRARGWQVVGLAVDNLEPVRAFLAKHPVGFAIGLAGMGGVELSRTMGNSAGALPFSIVFDRSGEAVERKLGVIRAQDLRHWVASWS